MSVHHVLILALIAAVGFAPRLSAARCEASWQHHVSRHETGTCGWAGGCMARNPHSTAIGCYQMTRAALVDVGWKNRNGDWLRNPYGIRSDDEFAAHYPAQTAALDHFTSLNWSRINSGSRALIGSTAGGVRITEGGLLSAAHFLGPGGLNAFAACGLRPDCIPDAAAAANGGRQRAYAIVMDRLAQGSALDVSEYTGFHTPGGGGEFTGGGAMPPQAPASAFLPWTGLRERERPPLQGERETLR